VVVLGSVLPAQSPLPTLRWFWLWDAYFGVSYLVTTGLLLTSGEAPPRMAGALTALTLIVPWYAAAGRPLVHGGERTAAERRGRGLGFAAGLGLLFGVATALDVASAFALFALCPMLLMTLPSIMGLVVVMLANLLPLALVWADHGSFDSTVMGVLPMTLLGIATAVLLGLWITRIVQQSRERAQLIAELERSREEVARLSRQAGIAAERERLAREIHDTVAQGLTSVIALIQAADSELEEEPELARRHLVLAARSAAENLTETRGLVAALTPVALRGNSLGEAVRRQGESLAAETGLTVRYAAQGVEFPLPTAVSVVLLRSAQEALANIRKHAQARQVGIRAEFTDAAVRLRIEDDGRGFTTEAGEAGMQGGYGLRGMRARVGEIGGTMSVAGGPGRGTVVEVLVPLDGAAQEWQGAAE
jgi:signal transduction histidine kinase